MKCPNGHNNPAGSKFCLECGLEIDSAYSDMENFTEGKSAPEDIFETVENAEFLNEIERNSNNISDLEDKSEFKNILKVSLLNDKEEIIREWTLSKFPSYSIGKISSKGGVDIDLSDIKGNDFISRLHGKFFKKNSEWIFVDVGSKNGSELFDGNIREKLVPNKEYKIKSGTILILAGTIKLLLNKE